MAVEKFKERMQNPEKSRIHEVTLFINHCVQYCDEEAPWRLTKPYYIAEEIFDNPSKYAVDFDQIQQRVNTVICQLRDDLNQLRLLESEWLECENNWQKVLEKRRSDQHRQEQKEQEQIITEIQRAEKVETKLKEDIYMAQKESIAEERQARRDKREQEKRMDLTVYTDPIIKAEERLDAEMLVFRQRNHAPIDDELAHCATEGQWKKTLRGHLDIDDAEDIFERYEKFQRRLQNALDTYKEAQE